MADIVKDVNMTLVQLAEMNEDGTCMSANEQHVTDGKTEAAEDPWKLPEVKISYTKWSELTVSEKVFHITTGIAKTLLVLCCLYFFICSLDLLGDAFRLLGGKTAGSVFQKNKIIGNPVAGLMMGILATTLLQSSSTTTGIVISLVVAKVLTVRHAIPIVMGANIGTSITNTLVSLGQITKKDQFRRAFAGATVHDMFNWLAVIVLLPIEAGTGFLYHVTKAIVSTMDFDTKGGSRKRQKLLKAIVKPFTNYIIRIDKKVFAEIAKDSAGAQNRSVIKRCCKRMLVSVNDVTWNVTNVTSTTISQTCARPCQFLFAKVTWSDGIVGVVLLIMTLVLLATCFAILVRTLYSALKGSILNLVRQYINADFPGKLSYFTGYVALVIGIGITMILQSSSVFTSSLTPLVGVGILSIERMYPLTLGANLGTTFTAIIVALSQNASDMKVAFHVALCHVFFNVSGILIFYPLPIMRIPIRVAKFLGNTTARYRWFGVTYILLMFVAFPLAVFTLSTIGWEALVCVAVPFLLILSGIFLLNVLQKSCPDVLPQNLKTWDFLPEALRSLELYDSILRKLCRCCFKGEEVA